MSKMLAVRPDLLKAHVKSYTRKDGTFVKEHDDKRQAAAQFSSHADARRKIAESAAPAVGSNVVRHTDGSGVSSVAHKTNDHASAKAAAEKLGQHLESHGFKRHGGSETKGGASAHYKHASGAKATVTHGAKMYVGKKGKMQAGVALDVHSGVQRDEDTPWQSAKAAATGSAAPAKTVNIGTEKWPMHSKVSERLPAKHTDGSTHHVGGFKAPDYPESGGATDGDVMVHHEGKTFMHTGKKGKNMKTGEDSYEYSNKDDGESRVWVSRSGHLMND